jgi:UDP-glucose 6-dehydrogenase
MAENLNQQTMATITLEYDGRNSAIKQLIGLLLTLGAKELKGYDETMQAISDYRNGNVTVCDSFEDYLKKVHA